MPLHLDLIVDVASELGDTQQPLTGGSCFLLRDQE
jgi:hypothetical protein